MFNKNKDAELRKKLKEATRSLQEIEVAGVDLKDFSQNSLASSKNDTKRTNMIVYDTLYDKVKNLKSKLELVSQKVAVINIDKKNSKEELGIFVNRV